MNIIKIAVLGISGVMLGILLGHIKSPFSGIISLATCLLIIFYSMTKLSSVFELLNTVSSHLAEQKDYFRILLKIIGITYVADFAGNICKDAGYGAIASQLEIFAKLAILALSMPILFAFIQTIGEFL